VSGRLARLRPSAALTPIAQAEISRAEAALGARFPDGYAALMTRFGRGVLGGLVRIYTPDAIVAGVEEWRLRIDEYWFWEATEGVLPKAHALECVVLGDTVGGDELIFHPSAPNRLYVLAHDFDQAHLVSEAGLGPALDWFFTSGVLDEPFEDDGFEPY